MADDLDAGAGEARIAEALRTAIRLSGVSNRHIERSLRLSTGYLTRILKGEVQLQVRLVLAVCKVIGLPPGNFWAVVFPPAPPPTEATQRLERGLKALHQGPERPAHSRKPEILLCELRAYLAELKEAVEKE